MDQSQPQWTPPPQQPTGWGGPGYGGPPVRPMGVTLAAIFLIVMGVLVTLAGGCAVMGGALLGGASGDAGIPGLGALGAGVAVFGIFILVIGILQIAAGAGALGGKGWGRWLGIVLAVVLAILGLLSLVGSIGAMNDPNSGGITSLIVSVIIVAGYALTAWALMQASTYFSYRR